MMSLLNQGLCRITEIQPGLAPIAVWITTDLTEHFPIYKARVATQADICRRHQLPVHLDVKRAKGGSYYVDGLTPIDFTKAEQPCVHCGEPSSKVDVGDGSPYFSCSACHHRMFLKPRRYADQVK